MRGYGLPLQTVRLKCFKAIRDSGSIRLTPLSVFIGNNASGKSSVIEALEALQTMVLEGIDRAMTPWHGFEHVWNQLVDHSQQPDQLGKSRPANPISFEVVGLLGKSRFEASLEVAASADGNRVYFSHYDASPIPGEVRKLIGITEPLFGDYVIHDSRLSELVKGWQFLSLNTQAMLSPLPQRRSVQDIRLARDGSNIAEYLQSVRDQAPEVLDAIVEVLRQVLPFASDMKPAITSGLERNVYLTLTESRMQLPSWLLSQGTLRLVALLAVLRHPKPPAVVFVEEIENGLDPRTIHLLVEELRGFVEAGGQVVATTHSPYLLDLLTLSQVIVVERDAKGAPSFKRPASMKALRSWAEKFSPGKLYTMGRLTSH